MRETLNYLLTKIFINEARRVHKDRRQDTDPGSHGCSYHMVNSQAGSGY